MAQQPPSSAALRATIERFDVAIAAAQAQHTEAETIARSVLIDDVKYFAAHTHDPMLDMRVIAPPTDETAKNLNDLLQARAVAVEMLAHAQEAERLARSEAARAQLRAVIKSLAAEAATIDAMSADLAKAIVGFGTLTRECEAILRLQLGGNPLPQQSANEIAKSVAAYIAASTGAFPPDHRPIAVMHATKFTQRSLGDAGAL